MGFGTSLFVVLSLLGKLGMIAMVSRPDYQTGKTQQENLVSRFSRQW